MTSGILGRARTVMLLAAVAVILGGCAAAHTMIAKGELETNTKMTDTIFLEPVGPDKKTIFVQWRNTTDKVEFDDARGEILAKLRNRGYQVVQYPDAAHYILQAYVLAATESSPSAAKEAYQAGYGNVGGVVTGGAVAYVAGADSGRGVVGGGLVGGAAALVANALVEDVTFTAVTDLQVSERVDAGSVQRRSRHQLQQGSSGATTETYESESQYKRYQTRIVSVANKANLDWEDAAGPLKQGLVRSVTGMF